jgi:hypothetical protein
VTDFTEEESNAFDLICVKSESVSNEIDESELQPEKQSEQTFSRRDVSLKILKGAG